MLQSRHGSRLPRSGSGPRARRVRPDRVRCLAAVRRGTHRLHLHRRTGDGRPAAGDHELAKWAPTAVNAQPLRVAAVQSPAARERLLPCLPRGNREQAAGGASHTRLRSRPHLRRVLAATAPARRAVPAAAGGGRGGDAGRVWARTSALIQTAYVIQAIRAVGLAAGPMNGDDAEALAAEFFAGQDVEVLLVINVGHPGPDAYQERNPRLPFEEVYRVL